MNETTTDYPFARKLDTEPAIGDLVAMPVPDFRDRYSVTKSVLQFDKPRNVWWTSTDTADALEIAQQLSKTQKKGGVFMGISGGVDSALTLSIATKPELVVLIDVNPNALNYLQYRLELTRQYDKPTDYLKHVFPGELPIHKIMAISKREDLYSFLDGTDLIGRDRRIQTNWKRINEGIAGMKDVNFIPTGVPIEDVVIAAVKNRNWIHDETDPRIRPDAQLYTFLNNVVHPASWLYLKDPTNYKWIKDAYAGGKIKFAQIPAQLLNQSPLYKILANPQNPQVDNFYLGNLNEYLGDKDFSRLTANLRALPGSSDMNVIYGSVPLQMVKLGSENSQGIEQAPGIRDDPWMAGRSPDITS